MKTTLLCVLILFANFAYACFSPIGGEEYNSVIKIQKLNDANTYQVSVPRYMDDDRLEAEIILAYSTGSPGGIPIYQKTEKLEPILVGDKFVAKFKVIKKDTQPYIVVMWWHKMDGMCGIQANSKFLEVE